MARPIIEVKNISKKFILTHNRLPYKTIRDSVMELAKKPFRQGVSKKHPTKENFWALKDISFDLPHGEVLGIIGPNGSGKSTLLKILSQITPPTAGEIKIHGHVASLLEVGTGFHPELTGRENIYLNGAILGMSRFEINKKFDEIVTFSGTEKFLDTPVKRFSSGMQVRLGFSVAAHLEPDILIVDEVLSVGDVEFQKKSLGKMDEVTKQGGRTIIFVSHNMDTIRRLCKKSILLREGKIEMFDETEKVTRHYLNGNNQALSPNLKDRKDRQGKGGVKFTKIFISNINGEDRITSGDKIRFRMEYESEFRENIQNVRVVIAVVNNDMRTVLWFDNEVSDDSFSELPPNGTIECKTGEMNLAQGRYYVHINFHIRGESRDLVMMAAIIDVTTDPSRYHFKTDPDNVVTNYLIPYSFKNI